MTTCNCEHWQVCQTCKPDMFDDEGNRLTFHGPEGPSWTNAQAMAMRKIMHDQAEWIKELSEKELALRTENERLKAELKSIDGALDDPRANLTLTTAEIIWEIKAELAEAKKGKSNEDLQDVVSKGLRNAWHLGQTYWQQADSEYYSQNKRAEETYSKFDALVDETLQAMKGK